MILDFEYKRSSPDGIEDPAALAWGEGILYLNGSPYWFHGEESDPEPIEWTWIELLEWLARKWISIRLEQTYPFGITPLTPSHFRALLNTRWQHASRETRIKEEDEIYSFTGRHDLSRAMRGIHLPTLSFIREGRSYWISTETDSFYLAEGETIEFLKSIGEQIRNYLSLSKSSRAVAAVTSWDNRGQSPFINLLPFLTGWRKEEVDHLPANQKTRRFWEIKGSDPDSEIAAAARFLSGMPSVADRLEILKKIRLIQHRDLPNLEMLSKQAQDAIAPLEDKHLFEQGYFLAIWLRNKLGIANQADPHAIITSLGVSVIDSELSRAFDAIGCWGPNHGPAVLLNVQSPRTRYLGGKQATLAHELCHLLIDRNKSFPLAEILRGNAPIAPEKRANAFAAELLLPRLMAREILNMSQSMEMAIHTMGRQFGVSRQLTIQHLHNDPEITRHITYEEKASLDAEVRQYQQ